MTLTNSSTEWFVNVGRGIRIMRTPRAASLPTRTAVLVNAPAVEEILEQDDVAQYVGTEDMCDADRR